MKNTPATNARSRPIDRVGLPYPKMFGRRLGPWLCAALLIALAACKSEPSGGNASSTTTGNAAPAALTQRVAVTAKAGAFEPAVVRLVQGVPALLEFTRVVDSACMNAVRMPWMKESVDLPMNEKVKISVDTSRTGTFSYSCWMDMVFGKVMIDKAEKVNPPSLLDGLSASDHIRFPINTQKKAIVKVETKSQQTFVGEGKVVAVVPNTQQIVVDHEEIKGFMEAMTMGFRVNSPSLFEGLKAGDHIHFTIDAQRKAIVKIEKLAPQDGAAEPAQEAVRQASGETASGARAPLGEPRGGRTWSKHIPNVVLTRTWAKK